MGSPVDPEFNGSPSPLHAGMHADTGTGMIGEGSYGGGLLGIDAPVPTRDVPFQGHWDANNSQQAWQNHTNEQEAWNLENPDPHPPDETPRSQYTLGSLPSAAPEFYEEEPVTLSRVEEVLAVEHGLGQACRTLPITMASWLFFTLLIFFHGQVAGSFMCADTIKQSMMSIRVPAVNATDTLRELRLGTITERHDILQWIQHGVVPALVVPGLKHGQLRRTQQLLGKVRVAQTRSTPADCGMNPALKTFYSGPCHPAGGTPGGFGWNPKSMFGTMKLDYAAMFVPTTIGSDQTKFVAWIDIGRPMAPIEEMFTALLDFDWLDDNTHAVTVEAMFLNTELNVYSRMQITFSLHRGGWIEQTIMVTPMRGDVYYHWAVIWLDTMWVTIMLALCWQATLHMLEEIHKGLFWWWITDAFVAFDFLSVLLGTGIAVYFYYMSVFLGNFVDRVALLGEMPPENGIQAAEKFKTRAILANWEYEKQNRAMLDDFVDVNWYYEWHRLFSFLYNIIIVARFFRGFTGQPRIAVILQTMTQVSSFMFHYLLIFVVIMANFIISGYILFGEEISDWSTLGKASCSGTLMLFGRFDYNEFHKVSPVNAFVWFSMFFILAVLIFTGLTTSTILYHYLAVRARTGQAGESIVKQVWEMLDNFCYNRTYDGAQKSLPPDKLFDMVTGDTDPLRIRHLGRFNIDRRLRTRHDIHEAEIDPKVDADFLLNRGMDPVTAERLLDRINLDGHHIEMRSSPQHRLTLFIARQMSMLRFGAEHMRKKTTDKVTWAAKSVDRLDLKHAKCVGLATRIRRAQTLPEGWTSHLDTNGRRYLRQEETGLTSWTLPRHLI